MTQSEVRLATPADEADLFSMCNELWEENGIFPISDSKVLALIRSATQPNSRPDDEPPALIGVIGPPNRVEASLALIITQHWYTNSWHVEELWNFVRPEYRKSNHAKSLIDFAKGTQAKLTIPLLIGVLSSERTAAKLRLYERRLGTPAGAYFIWPSWTAAKESNHQNAA